jgi:hypothetical protein
MSTLSQDILNAALAGLEARRSKIETQIQEVRGMMGRRMPSTAAPAETSTDDNPAEVRPKRVLSASARRRIADAQKKRWAAKRAAEA